MPNRLTLAEMSRLIRLRKLSPVELVAAHWTQIEKDNQAINAFVMQFPAESQAEARRLEDEPWTGPLHGIPVTVKDSFDIDGLPTLCGSRYRANHKATRNATAVDRLLGAGAVILGKTNCPEFLRAWETDNHIIGRTNNPWNPSHTAGGSSGGESAAISSFFSAGGVGSDGGGSIRVPAHFCGIAGLKPSPGRVSAAGHVPPIEHPGGLLGVAGPMARTVEDVKILFQALSGYDHQDPFSSPVPLREADCEGIRVGVMEQVGNVPVQDAVRGAVRKAAAMLADCGIPVEPFRPMGIENALDVWWFFFGELPASSLRELVAVDPAQAHWTGLELTDMAETKPISGHLVVEMLSARDRMRVTLLEQMKQHRVLLLPACGVTAFPHRQRGWQTSGGEIGLLQAMAPATPFNLMGMPGLALPVDITPDGLPVGVQLVGRPYEEELLLELGVRLEKVRGAFPLPGAAAIRTSDSMR